MNGTVAIGTSTKFTREDHVHPNDTSRAPLASPTFTGTPKAPTATSGVTGQQLANLDFVNAMLGGNTVPAKNLSANGYVKMANGLILQWGNIALGGNRQETVTFPITFPNECLNVQGSSRNIRYFSTYDIMVYSITPTQVVLDLSAEKGSIGAYWFAVGY